jgi:hypothetical protein
VTLVSCYVAISKLHSSWLFYYNWGNLKASLISPSKSIAITTFDDITREVKIELKKHSRKNLSDMLI